MNFNIYFGFNHKIGVLPFFKIIESVKEDKKIEKLQLYGAGAL